MRIRHRPACIRRMDEFTFADINPHVHLYVSRDLEKYQISWLQFLIIDRMRGI